MREVEWAHTAKAGSRGGDDCFTQTLKTDSRGILHGIHRRLSNAKKKKCRRWPCELHLDRNQNSFLHVFDDLKEADLDMNIWEKYTGHSTLSESFSHIVCKHYQ